MKNNWQQFTVEIDHRKQVATIKARTPHEAITKAQNWFGGSVFTAYPRIIEVEKLHIGDEVRWNDPDGGACSRNIVIAGLEVEGDVVKIKGRDGSYLECFAHEIS